MKRFLAATILTIAGLLIPATAFAERLPGSSHGGAPLSATLAPSVSGSNGSGFARVTVNPGQGEICYVVSVSNLTGPVIAAHIHVGPAGTNGPVVVPFNPSLGPGCTMVSRELALAILHNPSGYYVNVHTPAHPAGEIRGQLAVP
jgi:CHRD domain-containing protein